MHPHPNCTNGEDEVDCFDEYIAKKFVSRSADFICQSPYHNDGQNTTPTIHIIATACDGFHECWNGVDEKGCNLNGTQYTIGKCNILVTNVKTSYQAQVLS